MDELTATRIAAHLQKEVKQLASASKVAGDKPYGIAVTRPSLDAPDGVTTVNSFNAPDVEEIAGAKSVAALEKCVPSVEVPWNTRRQKWSLGSALALVVLNCLQHLPCGLGFQFMVWKFTFGFVYCSWPGGLPVFTADGKQCIGGVGVSGSSGKDDVQVAEACMLAAGLSKLDDGRWAYTAVAENE
mmetsp:Transcript_1183/g.3411  ORF Transcript_1183/g.3411 Transcript_1183/m.3411 type:complete len:186 (-) Transcript_1183:63-620(-)